MFWLWNTISAIVSITIIDLVLSGDNAAVIGLAIRKLPGDLQKKAAVIGTGGAILLRVTFTIFAVYLLQVRYLSAAGGLILIWITYKLLHMSGSDNVHVSSGSRFWSAVGTIIIADLSMAFDNVMGVAGAAHGEIWLVVFGLLVSIPILVFGSTWLAAMMGRYPVIIYLGATVLAHTAIKMIIQDQALNLSNLAGMFWSQAIPWICSLPILAYGFYLENIKIVKWHS